MEKLSKPFKKISSSSPAMALSFFILPPQNKKHSLELQESVDKIEFKKWLDVFNNKNETHIKICVWIIIVVIIK